MVPAHIEQECNAFDAMQNGAGIIDHNFNLSNLLRFSQNYKPTACLWNGWNRQNTSYWMK